LPAVTPVIVSTVSLKLVSSNKYYDDLTKQNSLIYQNWKVYRWVYNQLKQHPEKVKDELRIFVESI